MSGDAHRGDHDIAFYEATIGHTFEGAGDVVPSFVNSDADGPIPPARYLIQLAELSKNGAFCWVGFSPFVKTVGPNAVVGPGPSRIPLSELLGCVETNILAGVDDRITLQTTEGTAVVYVTRISTRIPKGVKSS